MPDIRGASHDCGPRRENVCIDSYRILDSCKDKDCFEDTQLMLTDYGQELIDKSSSVRVASTEILWTDISVSPVKFNKGFYQIGIRFYTKVILEACVSLGKVQEIEAVAVNDKCVVLYGGEGSVKSFKSGGNIDDFCMCKNDEMKIEGKPTVVVDMVDPIALSVKVTEQKLMSGCCCCCCCDDLPPKVMNALNGSMSPSGEGKNVYVSLGFFSVIRMERPAQFILSASEYCVPDKVCGKCAEDDPCAVFAKMSFPVNEFCACPYPSDKNSCDKKC